VVVETIAWLEELLTNRGAPGWSLFSAEPRDWSEVYHSGDRVKAAYRR